MKKKILFGFVLSASVLLFNACIEDHGNYDYDTEKTVKITLPDNWVGNRYVYPAYPYEPFIFEPEIDFKGLNENDFTYAWYAFGDTISTSKVLDHIYYELGESDHAYAVIHKDGSVTVANFRVSVQPNFHTGWLILSNRNGESVLHYARPEEYVSPNGDIYEYKPFPDIYADFNDSPLGTDPVGLVQHPNDTSTGDEIMVLQNGGESVWLSGVDFREVITLKEEFMNGDYPPGFQPSFALYDGSLHTLVSTTGKMLWKYSLTFGYFRYARFSDVYPLPDAVIEKGWLARSGVPIIYDRTTDALFGLHGDPSTAFRIKVDDEFLAQGITDLGDLQGAEIMYIDAYRPAGVYWQTPATFTIIIKKGSDYYLQRCNLVIDFYNNYDAHMGHKVKDNNEYMIDPSEELFLGNNYVTDNTFYCPVDDVYFFFAEGNKIYLYHQTLNEIIEHHVFPAGTTITQFQPNPSRKRIGVTLDNGEFYVFNVEYDSVVTGQSNIVFQMSGVGDVVQLIWKYGNSGTFTQKN